jgi:N4-gp56 family major capsid protein
MASSFIDKTTLAQVIGTSFDNVTVRPLRPNYIFDAIAQEKNWNLNTNPNRGDALQFPVLSALSANTAALDPTASTITGSQKLSYTRRSVTLEAYGDHSTLDLLESSNEVFIDDVADAVFNLSDQAMNSINLLARSAMDLNKYSNETSGTLSNTYHGYGSYGIGSGTAGPLKAVTVREVVASLRASNVPTFEDGLYRCVLHPNQYTQLRADSDNASWTKIHESGTNELASAIARANPDVFEGVRFILNTEVAGASSNTMSCYFAGRDFVGKAIGRDVMIKTNDVLAGPQENLLTVHWNALLGYKIIRRESGRIIETVTTVQ